MSTQAIAMHTENVGKHFKILIIAEGFKSNEMGDFDDFADRVKDTISSFAPFSNNLSKINFYKVSSESVDSGRSILAGGLINGTTISASTKNTYWGVYSDEIKMPRLLGMPLSKRQKLEDDYGDFDNGNMVFAIFVSKNNSNDVNFWGGNGELPSFPVSGLTGDRKVSYCAVSTYDLWNGFEFLVRHEFSHSFSDLDDEYFADCKTTTGWGCGNKNKTGIDVTDWTWHHYDANDNSGFLDHPNRRNIKDSSQSGFTLKGGRYLTDDKFRGSDNDVMRGKYILATSKFPMNYSNKNSGFVQDRINEEVDSTSFSIYNLAYLTLGKACKATSGLKGTKYHNGSDTLPKLGDYIYTDSAMQTSFNGQSKWFRLYDGGIGDSVQINSDGKVIYVNECVGGYPT